MSDIRPISMCSVSYKIISKILIKSLQHILHVIMTPFQSTFVAERMISDNILIAHKIGHALHTRPSASKEFLAIKSDMSKAYDRVELSYLKALLLALGFHNRWVEWIMSCVSTVTFSVLVNDQPFRLISLSRGLRQEYFLSPFFFVLCTKGMSHLLSKTTQNGSISGMQFSQQGPAIHHFLFADDSLFVCKTSEDEVTVLQHILKTYGEATGQVFNLYKSSLTFGNFVEEDIKQKIKEITGMISEGGARTYLGLPECFSGSKIELLSFIHERMKPRMSLGLLGSFLKVERSFL